MYELADYYATWMATEEITDLYMGNNATTSEPKKKVEEEQNEN